MRYEKSLWRSKLLYSQRKSETSTSKIILITGLFLQSHARPWRIIPARWSQSIHWASHLCYRPIRSVEARCEGRAINPNKSFSPRNCPSEIRTNIQEQPRHGEGGQSLVLLLTKGIGHHQDPCIKINEVLISISETRTTRVKMIKAARLEHKLLPHQRDLEFTKSTLNVVTTCMM